MSSESFSITLDRALKNLLNGINGFSGHKGMVFLVVLVVLFASCKTGKIVHPNSKPEVTSNMQVGEHIFLEIPGSWHSSSVNRLSNQYFLRDQDSSLVSVSVNPVEKFPFYQEMMPDSSFISGVYDWESQHFKSQAYEVALIELNATKHYVLWDMSKESKQVKMLYGIKGKEAISVNYLEMRGQGSSDERRKFLIRVFENFVNQQR